MALFGNHISPRKNFKRFLKIFKLCRLDYIKNYDPSSIKPSNEDWNCEICTFQNSADKTHCEMCQSQRKDSSLSEWSLAGNSGRKQRKVTFHLFFQNISQFIYQKQNKATPSFERKTRDRTG